jgi:hypothetical protein
MDHIGIDVHKRDSQIYILAEEGEIIEQRIRTEPERFGRRTLSPSRGSRSRRSRDRGLLPARGLALKSSLEKD